MKQNLSFTNFKGDKLVGRLTSPSGDVKVPLIIWCYGHSSWMTRPSSKIMVREFIKQSWSVLQFDFYGHGKSEGDFANATPSEIKDDVLQAITLVKQRGYRKIGLVGSSFGGLACLLAAAVTPDIFALALKSPVADYASLFSKETVSKWQKEGYIPYPERPETHTLNYIFYTDSVMNNAYKVAGNINAPTLIVHGNADREVPISQSQQLVKLMPHANLKVIEGADHNYSQPGHAQQMLRAITGFIIDHI